MDKNTWIGFALIAAIIVGFSFLNRPSEEELAERKRVQDSIALVQAQEIEAKLISEQITAQLQAEQNNTTAEQLAEQLAAVYGPFAPATEGKEGLITIENSKVRIGIAHRGGRIAKAELKEYKAYGDSVNPLCLFQGGAGYIFQVPGKGSSRLRDQCQLRGTGHDGNSYGRGCPGKEERLLQ